LIGWQENMLYLEVHPSVKKQKNYHIQIKNKLKKKFSQYPQGENVEIDWNTVEQVISQAKGLPFSVLNNGDSSFKFTRKYPEVKRPLILNNIPRVPNLLDGEWSILVEIYSEQGSAEKLSAILNHQGPQITSRVSKNNHLYQVVSGPFSSKKLAKQTVKRIFREFEIVALKVQKYRAY
jgi:L,D-transpeptidase ErfK/SrfK